MTPDYLREKLNSNVPDVYNVIVIDTSSGCGQSFEVVVVSNTFAEKNKLQRSRLVNKALQAEIAEIHAFSCKCYTEEEWSKNVV